MAKDVVVKISAQDNASPVLRRIGTEAQTMGSQVTQSAERSGQSFQKFSAGAAAVGAAVTSATLVLGEWTRAAAEDQANQARLQQSVENTGKAYTDYAQRIDDAIKKGQQLAFTDDDTRAALVNLNLVTNDTNASLNELGVVMDFARAKGISLSDASSIVGKVMGGNLGILSRYGIQLDKNATSEQALAAIQQRSAGQATTYAHTQLGQIDIMKDKWSELTETIGYHAGALTKVLMILPGLTAGYAALGAAVSGLGGAGGLAATGALGAALALAVGGAAAGYSANTDRGGWGDNLFSSASIKGAGIANWLVPGNPFNGIQDQFQNLKDGDNLAKISKALFYSPQGSESDAFYIGQLKESGVLPYGFKGTLADAADYISKAAVATGVSNQGYIANQIGSSTAYVYDPVGQRYVAKGDYPSLQNNRYFAQGGNLTSGATTMGYGAIAGMGQGPTGPGAGYQAWLAHGGSTDFYGGPSGNGVPMDTKIAQHQAYMTGGSGAVANDISAGAAAGRGGIAHVTSQELGNQQTQAVNELNDALTKRLGIYANLVNGTESVNDAQAQFKATQDGILQSEQTYTGQLGEYNSQLSALTNAYDLINGKKEQGVALTQQETDFLNGYADANDRLTGGVNDATESLGFQAEQYAKNMEIGDQLNQSLQGQTGAVGDLIDTIQTLIMSLNGIPPDVQTQIELMGGDEAIAAARQIQYALESAAGTYVANFIVTAVGGNAPQGPQLPVGGFNGLTAYANGGTAYDPLMPRFANGGSMYALVGEVGPEIVKLSRGDQVTPTGASRSQMSRMTKGGGGNTNFYGPVTLVPAGQDAHRAISQAALGEARY